MNDPYKLPAQRHELDDWRGQARCAQIDPERWFPEQGGNTMWAKRICGECPVSAECLEDALQRHEPYGIYGGLTGKERRKLRAS